MRAHWQNEKESIQKIGSLKSRSNRRKIEAATAERNGQLEKAAKLTYGDIPELEKQLAGENDHLSELQKDIKIAQGRGRRGGYRDRRRQVDRRPRLSDDGGRDREARRDGKSPPRAGHRP